MLRAQSYARSRIICACDSPPQMSHQAVHFRGIFWSGYQNSPRVITGALNSGVTNHTVELITLSSRQVTQLDCRKNWV
jgi:hypothetical protein